MTPSTLFPCLGLTAAAAVLVGCGSTQQHMNLTAESLLTPSHHMSYADYPFDASGRYLDSWAAAGARRYGSRVDSDHQDHGRARRKQPSAGRSSPPSTRPRSSGTASTAKKTSPSQTRKPPTAARTHIVKPGDSLYSIGRRYGVSVQALKNANGLKSDSIRDGRKLVIPR